MFNVILFNPQIPPNTGNIIRLCSNTNTKLFIIEPIGFEISDKSLKRAGLDYHKDVEIKIFETLRECCDFIKFGNFFFITKFGNKNYCDINFKKGDSLIFGSEISGIPDSVFEDFTFPKLMIPIKDISRSLNLSNSVSIVLYEALRQNKFF